MCEFIYTLSGVQCDFPSANQDLNQNLLKSFCLGIDGASQCEYVCVCVCMYKLTVACGCTYL